jgi:hypothetical protein
MNQVAIETPETVEFGGLVWKNTHRANLRGVDYRTFQPGVGNYRVYQYPLDDEQHVQGKWLWADDLIGILHPLPNPSHLDMEPSAIVQTREEAMQCCLEAKGKFIEQVCMLAQLFGAKNSDAYAAGFFAGRKVGMETAIRIIKESI